MEMQEMAAPSFLRVGESKASNMGDTIAFSSEVAAVSLEETA
jgi:hypothetical protein